MPGLWFPPVTVPVGFGQERGATRLPVLTMVSGYSRWLSAVLVPSRHVQDLFAGWWQLIWRLGAGRRSARLRATLRIFKKLRQARAARLPARRTVASRPDGGECSRPMFQLRALLAAATRVGSRPGPRRCCYARVSQPPGAVG